MSPASKPNHPSVPREPGARVLEPEGLEPQLLERMQKALADVRAGKAVILVDDEDRENEGDLMFAAEHATPEAINFMAKYGRGLICLALTERQIQRLDLAMMPQGGAPLGTAFTLSIEARHGVTTGISAADRSRTIQVAIAPDARPEDVVTPGHIFPLKAREGGVLVRTGQTEGSVDLAALAGLLPAGVICEIMNDDGTMARLPDLVRFAEEHQLQILTIADLIRYRLATEVLVQRRADFSMRLDATGTEWRAVIYDTSVGAGPFLALVKGEPARQPFTACRVHSGGLIADVFGSDTLEGRHDLRHALAHIENQGHGVLVYLPPKSDIQGELTLLGQRHASGRQASPATEEAGMPPGPPLREFGLGAQILRDLGLQRIQLLTNHPRKIAGIEGYGLEVIECLPLGQKPATPA
jgi:3,4-dihydroxy 2-butanone 4-phosphate synthase / GTP cyclohydrolase II